MSTLKLAIVDDEKLARNVLIKLIRKANINADIIGEFSSLMEFVEFQKSNAIDAVFLDIQMPHHYGYEITNFIPNINFEIVFVTAYDKYAIKAFELSAIDYLVKPVYRDRFYNSLARISDQVTFKKSVKDYDILMQNFQNKRKKLVIPEIDKKRVIPIDEILCIQGQGSYAKIYLMDTNSIVVSKNLKKIEELMPDDHKFFRSQRSWLINMEFIAHYKTKKQLITLKNGLEVRLSKHKVKEFEILLKTNSTN